MAAKNQKKSINGLGRNSVEKSHHGKNARKRRRKIQVNRKWRAASAMEQLQVMVIMLHHTEKVKNTIHPCEMYYLLSKYKLYRYVLQRLQPQLRNTCSIERIF